MGIMANPTVAFVTAASAAYTKLAELAAFGGNTELAAAYEAVRDALDMFGDADDGEAAISLLSGTMTPAQFCRDFAEQCEDLADSLDDEDPACAEDTCRQVVALRNAAAMFDKLGR